jgi:PAS domain S-box-containing protein
MLDAAPASITVHDFDGRFHYANRKTFDMHGYEDSEFMALRLHDLDVPESAALIAERMQLIKEKGEATFEASHFHKNGVAIQMEVFVKVVEWQGASALLSIASDITERKLAEEAVRKSEEKYRNLFDNALEGVYQSTPEGRLISANMAFARMFGYASPEDIFNTVTDIASQMYANPDDRKIAVGILMETGQIKDFECRMRRKDGSIFWARFDGRFTKTKYGKPCFQGFVIDITERKQAEEAVQNARWFLQRVQDALSFHIAILDEAGVIVQVNTAWRNFGKQNDLQHPNSCIGQSYLDVCEQASGPDSEEALLVAQAIRDLLAGRQDRAAIEYPCHAPYEERWFVVHITRFDDNHRWIVVAHENITDRKQIEEEIRKMNDELESRVRGRTAQLEASNKALEAFSSSVSHDLRAPLRSIEGFSHAILEEYREKLDETGQNYLDRVCGAARRMGQLIDDTLKLSRVARFDFQCAAVDLSRMVREIAEAHQQSNPDRVVDVNVQEGIIVQGDRHLMKIAMENLVGNAFKFTGKAAHPQIEFGKTIKDDEIAYYVRDNGAGFDMAYVDKLFGPFQRLHTAEEFAGTGIGLATVQRIIARHGGRVWAEGEAGKGATFYFTLCAPIA